MTLVLLTEEMVALHLRGVRKTGMFRMKMMTGGFAFLQPQSGTPHGLMHPFGRRSTA
jgi:hypothetical protein